jgi:hypothetical protein
VAKTQNREAAFKKMGLDYTPGQVGPDGIDLGWMAKAEYEQLMAKAGQGSYVQKPGSKKRVPSAFAELDPNGGAKYELGSKVFSGPTK